MGKLRLRKRALGLLAALSLTVLGTFAGTAQAAQQDDPPPGPNPGDGPSGSSFFIGNCLRANNITIDPDVIPFCGVGRAAYNATGAVLTRNARFLGNDITVIGGTLRIRGGIFENNTIVGDKIIIEGNNSIFLNNRFIGNVYVEDVDAIAAELENVQLCADHFLSDYSATQQDGQGPLHRRQTGIHTYNIRAAARTPVHDSFTSLHRYCGKKLLADDFSYFSAIATARYPRPDLKSDPVIHYADLKFMSNQVHDCRLKMRTAKNRSGAGAGLKALLDCANTYVHNEL
ncbi:hypothetical protein ACPC54_38660 [Kitasatospora sp. NPDC094028]